MSDRPAHPLWELSRARYAEFVRQPGAVFWTFGFPLLLALGLGIAFREQPPDRPRVALDDSDPALRAAADALEATGDVELLRLDADGARRALRRERADLWLDVTDAGLVYRFDPDRPDSRHARLITDAALQRGFGREDAVITSDAPYREKGGRYIDFLIPGLVGLNLMGAAMWGIGFRVVQARTGKRLKRFAATPMRRSHFLLSYMLSRLVFLGFQVAALLGIGWLVFDVTVQGSGFTLLLVLLAGSLAFSGIALLVAARPRSIESAQGWMNFVQLPMWVLSGCFFAYERFPEAVHPFLRALPLTALNDGLRAVMNEARPLSELLLELGVLTAWATLSFVVALRTFRWQ